MRSILLSLVVLAFLLAALPFGDVMAAKGDLAVRGEYDAFGNGDYDQPLNTIAVFSGRCRDVDVPLSDSRQIFSIYRATYGENKEKMEYVGKLYHNDRGHEAVCVDDSALNPFVEVNVRGDVVSVRGIMTMGDHYGMRDKKILLIESMEQLDDW